jgi:uncharacterized protein involved in exopolysaccharide biosynthesis
MAQMTLAPHSDSLRAPGAQLDEELISLKQLLTPLWKGKWFIVAVTALAAVTAGAVAQFFIPKKYEAAVVLSAVSEENNASRLGALGAIASQFGGLSSLMGGGANDRRSELLAILQSDSLTTEFIRQNDMLPILFADKWDADRKRWKDMAPDEIPTLWKANRFFKQRVRGFSTDSKTGLSSLRIIWTDPQLAAKWANDLVTLGNEYVRQKAIQESERNVAYLNSQLEKSTVVAVQNSISALLENEFKKVMLAQGSKEYAYRVIDAATVPERRSSPSTVIWAIVGFLGGLIASSGLVLIHGTLRPS